MYKKIARVSFIYLLLLLFIATNVNAATIFKDVDKSNSHYEGIMNLTEKGIINGYPDGSFKPGNPIKRSQTAVLFAKALDLSDEGFIKVFQDIDINHQYASQIISTYRSGIFRGSNGYFNDGPLTREQMATVLIKSFNLKSNEKKVSIYTGNVSQSHRENVKILAQHGITNQLGDFRPSETVTRGQFATFFYKTIQVTDGLDTDQPEESQDPGDPGDSGDIDEPKEESPKKLSTKEIVQLNDPKVVLIETNLGQGSGIIVGNGLILTNEHVIDGIRGGKIILNDGAVYEIDGVVKSDKIKDLALVKAKRDISNVNPINIGTSESLEKGNKIVAIGSPRGLQNTVSEGIVSSFRYFEGVKHIQISVPIDHGSSGGGLFNTEGSLVGITTSGLNSNANLNFAVSIDEASSWYEYFDMKFKDIPVDPIATNPVYNTLPIPGLSNIALGMTKEEVKRLETAPILRENTDNLMYRNKSVFDFSADITYTFENKKLTRISVFHNVVHNKYDLDLLEIYFIVMYDNFSSIYGEPVFIDNDWYDGNGYSLSALWKTGSQDTFLNVNVNLDYSSYGGFSISSN